MQEQIFHVKIEIKGDNEKAIVKTLREDIQAFLLTEPSYQI